MKVFVTPFTNEVFSLLKFMQSLGDVIAYPEFNRRSTHTIWIEISLSLELIYYEHFV